MMNQKDMSLLKEPFTKFFLKLFICGDNIWDLVPIITKDTLKADEFGFYEEVHPYLKWQYCLHEGTSDEISAKIREKIERDFKKPNEREKNNVVICRMSNAITSKHLDLIVELSKISPGYYQPIIIFISEDKDVQSKIRDKVREAKIQIEMKDSSGVRLKEAKIPVDIRDIFGIQILNNDLTELNRRLLMSTTYYNQLGDKFFFPSLIEISNAEQIKPKGLFLRTINIVLVGTSVCGKSTFINQIMGEKRSLERKGLSETLSCMEYNNFDYPIVMYDTKGFETKQDKELLLKAVTELKNEKAKGKDKIDLIFYFINGSNCCLKSEDIDLIQKLVKLGMEIYILVTHCETKCKGKDKVDNLKSNLRKLKFPIYPINNRKPLLGFNDFLYDLYSDLLDQAKKAEEVETPLEDRIDIITSEALYKVGNYLTLLLRKELFSLLLYWNKKDVMFSAENKSIEITKMLFTFLGLKINTKEAKIVIKTFKVPTTMKLLMPIINAQQRMEVLKESIWLFNVIINIDKSGTIDLPDGLLFRRIYDIMIFGICDSLPLPQVKMFIEMALPLILISCKALTIAFEEISLSIERLDNLLNEDYIKAIDSFEAMSKFPKFIAAIANKGKQNDRLGRSIFKKG